MTVYVDNMEAAYGRMTMCHCWADTREELFAMMDRIGVKLKWFQRPDYVGGIGMKASWEHFDIAKSKRALAIQHGAVEVCQFTMAEHANRQQFICFCALGHWRRAEIALRFYVLASAARMRREPT